MATVAVEPREGGEAPSWRHCGREVPYAFVVGHPTGGNVHLRMALYRAVNDEQLSLDLSKAIVAAKLQNSRKVVARWARDANDPALADQMVSRSHDILERVARLPRAPTPNHVRGVEGDAARIYFGAVRQVSTVEPTPLHRSAPEERPRSPAPGRDGRDR